MPTPPRSRPKPPSGKTLPARPSPRRPAGFLVRRLQQVSLSIFHSHLEPLDLTPLQMTVLLAVRAGDGMEQVAVAARACIDTSTLKDVVNRLEAKGLLRREPGLEDRRKRFLYLEPAGRTLLARAQPEVRRASRLLLAPLTSEEREQLLDLAERVIAAHESAGGAPDAGSRAAPWRRGKAARRKTG